MEQSNNALSSNLKRSSSLSGLWKRPSGFIRRSLTSWKSAKSHKNLTGASGVVYKARDRKTGLDFCCKSIRKELLTPEVSDGIKHEAEVMMHLRGHPNIVEIMGLFEDASHIHIIQELCAGGDLLSKMAKSLEPCSEDLAAYITRSMLLVIRHCHSCGVIYRDIKPDNFLLSSDGPDAVLKATDFGISKFMKPGETPNEFMGTPTYMAPEVFDMECGFPSDIWSAGVMLYWILCGEFPFKVW
ncbi:kinase-like domain-containing protein [Dunaliella salina]|uniref:Kinase-like domain-containing protein n=1 Tax=Dunaliella salina TaxID=3046 RepID=A0ABQ7FYN2_DUNSA|nr:kinase-like domain-containing protein [Dunaliella salina]|eukprot:KAF5827472.1 kinase-like domain-containing protein [Dunaliella salina]